MSERHQEPHEEQIDDEPTRPALPGKRRRVIGGITAGAVLVGGGFYAGQQTGDWLNNISNATASQTPVAAKPPVFETPLPSETVSASPTVEIVIIEPEDDPLDQTPTPTVSPTTSPTIEVSQTTAPLPTENPAASGDSWLSGTATSEQGNTNPAEAFGSWRGSDVEIGQTWPNTPDLWGINPSIQNSWANFSGPMSLSITPGLDASGNRLDWTDPTTGETLTGWQGWEATANGEQDKWWHAIARNTKKLRDGKAATYISPFYEYNGDWMKYSVNGDVDAFKQAWERVAGIWREEMPEAKLVLPAACNRGVPDEMLPNPDTYDVFGCTIYNAWPWSANGDETMAKLEVARLQALKAGKPIAITEWANSANAHTDGGGGDAPGFIAAMHAWMKQHAGTGPGNLVFETFFNIDGYTLDHRLLDPNGHTSATQPKTAEAYRRFFRES